MQQIVDYGGYVNLVLFTVVALVALRQWRLGRGRAGLWAALTFGVLAFVVLAAAWFVARPFIYRAFPEFNATRQGAPGFPLIIHIGIDTLDLTNRSGEHWVCDANVGYAPAHGSTLTLEAGQTRRIPWANFQAPGYTVDISVLRSEARDKIVMRCSESSGVTHYYDFD